MTVDEIVTVVAARPSWATRAMASVARKNLRAKYAIFEFRTAESG